MGSHEVVKQKSQRVDFQSSYFQRQNSQRSHSKRQRSPSYQSVTHSFLATLLVSVLSVSLAMALPRWAQAQRNESIATDADFFEKDSKNQKLHLRGHVNVTYKGYHIVCDEADLDQKTDDLDCRGHVTLKTPQSVIRGDRIEFNLQTQKATVHEGTITSGQALLDGETIVKTEEPNTYVATNAYLTSCLTCPASWSLKSKQIKATMGKYATLKRPYLSLLGLPVLWLPYLGIPLNSKRKTGLLFPSFFSSNYTGFGILTPFFWAINRSQDLTITTGYYWIRKGPHLLLDYRYASGPLSEGSLSFGYLRDRFDDRPDHRWFFRFNQVYQLPQDYSFFMNLQLTEDTDYLRDFPTHLQALGQPALDNRISLSKNTKTWHLSVDTSYYVSLLEREIRTDNRLSLHRFPSLNFRTKEFQLWKNTPLTFQYRGQYLNVGRQGPAFDSVELCDGSLCIPSQNSRMGFQYFNSNNQTSDLIRTGQRVDQRIELSSPFWIGPWLDIKPQLTLRHTQYALGVPSIEGQNYDALPSRSLIKAEMNVRTFLSRVYSTKSDDRQIKHTIIPRVHYQFLPFFRQSDHFFFGTNQQLSTFREAQPVDDTDLDIHNGGRGIQFDFNDRIVGRHLIRYGLINRINVKQGSSYKQLLRFDLSQAFDIRESTREGGLPWQQIRGDINFRVNRVSLSGWAEHYPYHDTTNMALRSQWKVLPFLNMTLNYQLNTPITQDPADTDSFFRNDSIDFGLGYSGRYFRINGMVFYSPRGDTVQLTPTRISEPKFRRWRVDFDIRPPGRCWRIYGFVGQVLGSEDIQRSVQGEFLF